MKTKKLVLLLVFFTLMLNVRGVRAQFQLINNLTCDVQVCYEMWDVSCQVCKFGCLTVFAGGTPVVLTNCANIQEIWITVNKVGTSAITWNNGANSDGVCNPPSGAFGQSSTIECGGWSANINFIPNGPWIIQ